MIKVNGVFVNEFGISDYWRMFRARGIKLSISYFFQNHLFDIVNRTDTHTWLTKESYSDRPENFDQATFYMSSWTSEIKYCHRWVKSCLGNKFSQFNFLDVGSGKGKVVILWSQLSKRDSIIISGVEYSKELNDIAKKNVSFFSFGENLSVRLENTDILKFNFNSLGKKIIIYMFNPFAEELMANFLNLLSEYQIILIYNNPVHSKVVSKHGFVEVHQKMGFHQNCQTKIYFNFKLEDLE